MQVNNPFAGSKIILSKKVTRKTFESNPDKYGKYVYDAERDCDINEFYEIVINPEGDYLLIRENQ
jgi:hypothetical protein